MQTAKNNALTIQKLISVQTSIQHTFNLSSHTGQTNLKSQQTKQMPSSPRSKLTSPTVHDSLTLTSPTTDTLSQSQSSFLSKHPTIAEKYHKLLFSITSSPREFSLSLIADLPLTALHQPRG